MLNQAQSKSIEALFVELQDCTTLEAVAAKRQEIEAVLQNPAQLHWLKEPNSYLMRYLRIKYFVDPNINPDRFADELNGGYFWEVERKGKKVHDNKDLVDAKLQALDLIAEKLRLSPDYKFVEAIENCRRAGHILGLDDEIFVTIPGDILTVKFEGNFPEISRKYVIDLLQGYIATLPEAKQFEKELKEKFETILAIFKGEDKHTRIFSSGWKGHAVYLAKSKDELIYNNRGDFYSEKSYGVKLFAIRNSAFKLEEAFKGNERAYDFENSLRLFVDLDKPSRTFHEIKAQKHGTCSFVNAKSLVLPLLMWMGVPGKTGARTRYKEFTHWGRTSEVKKLIAKLEETRAANDSISALYFAVLRKYITKTLIQLCADKISKNKRAALTARYNEISAYFNTFAEGQEFMRSLPAITELNGERAELEACYKNTGHVNLDPQCGPVVPVAKHTSPYRITPADLDDHDDYVPIAIVTPPRKSWLAWLCELIINAISCIGSLLCCGRRSAKVSSVIPVAKATSTVPTAPEVAGKPKVMDLNRRQLLTLLRDYRLPESNDSLSQTYKAAVLKARL